MHTSCMHSCMRSCMQVRPVGRVVSVGLLVVSRVVERRFVAGEPPRGGDRVVARGPRGRSKRRETTSDGSRRRRFARPGDHGHDAFGDEEVEVRRVRRRGRRVPLALGVTRTARYRVVRARRVCAYHFLQRAQERCQTWSVPEGGVLLIRGPEHALRERRLFRGARLRELHHVGVEPYGPVLRELEEEWPARISSIAGVLHAEFGTCSVCS